MRVTAAIAASSPQYIAWIADNSLHILNLDAHTLTTRKLSNPILSVLLSNSFQLLTAHSPAHLRIHSWETVSSRLVPLAPRTGATYDSPPRILHVADGGGDDGEIDALLTTNTTLVRVLISHEDAVVTDVIPHNHAPLCACIHPETRLLAIANTNATVDLYSISSLICSFNTRHNVTSLLFCRPPPEKPQTTRRSRTAPASSPPVDSKPEQLLLIAATLNASVLIYRISASPSSSTDSAQSSKPSKPLVSLSVPQSHEKLLFLARSPCHKYFAIGGADAKVLVYSLSKVLTEPKPTPLCTYLTHNHPISALAFTADSRHLIAGCANGAVYRFSVSSEAILLKTDPPEPLPITEPHPANVSPYTPLNHILIQHLPFRDLLYTPAEDSPLQCRLCDEPFDAFKRKPVVCAECVHTHACEACHRRVLATDSDPKCTLCRLPLQSYTYNYQLLSNLAPTKAFTSTTSDSELCKVKNYVDVSRISFIESPEFLFSQLDTASYYTATMDGSPILVRLPHRYRRSENQLVMAVLTDQQAQTQGHLRNAEALTGPNIAHVYAVSRMGPPDNRVIIACEPLEAGTLADWTNEAQRKKLSLRQDLLVSLCLNLTRLVRFLHQSNTAAAHALSPQNLAFTRKLDPEHPAAPGFKLLDVGSTAPVEHMSDTTRPFLLSFLPYTSPELFGPNSKQERRGTLFHRACRADMYALGVLMWQIASAEWPFKDMSSIMVMAMVESHGIRPGDPPDNLPPSVQKLIVECWRKDPEKRPDVLQACRVLEQVPTAPPISE